MSRKIRSALWTLAALLATTPAFADDYAFGFNPRSGDAWIDAQLGECRGGRHRHAVPACGLGALGVDQREPLGSQLGDAGVAPLLLAHVGQLHLRERSQGLGAPRSQPRRSGQLRGRRRGEEVDSRGP